MGLTIHYDFNVPEERGFPWARNAIAQLFAFAQSLKFDYCSEFIEWDDQTGDPEEGRWQNILSEYGPPTDNSNFLDVPPVEYVMFVVRQNGSETAKIGIGRYAEHAADLRDRSIVRPTGLKGFVWRGFCKTQYAGTSTNGGWDNFFKIHNGLCRIFDKAISIGFAVTVRDDAAYWETRDAAKLAQQLDRHNQLVAAFTGKLKDAIGERSDGQIISALDGTPEFDGLEAKGRELFKGQLEQIEPDDVLPESFDRP